MIREEMNDLELNKKLQEKFFGCWHEGYTFYQYEGFNKCDKCGSPRPFFNPSFTTSWSDYGRLLEKVMEEKKYHDFIRFLAYGDGIIGAVYTHDIYNVKTAVDIITDKQKGSRAIAEFFCKDK
jgi:hypothetical protein